MCIRDRPDDARQVGPGRPRVGPGTRLPRPGRECRRTVRTAGRDAALAGYRTHGGAEPAAPAGCPLMILGIDASRALRPTSQRTGTELYAHHLIDAMLKLAPELPSAPFLRLYSDVAPDGATRQAWQTAEWRVMPSPRLWTHARLSLEMARRPPAGAGKEKNLGGGRGKRALSRGGGDQRGGGCPKTPRGRGASASGGSAGGSVGKGSGAFRRMARRAEPADRSAAPRVAPETRFYRGAAMNLGPAPCGSVGLVK